MNLLLFQGFHDTLSPAKRRKGKKGQEGGPMGEWAPSDSGADFPSQRNQGQLTGRDAARLGHLSAAWPRVWLDQRLSSKWAFHSGVGRVTSRSFPSCGTVTFSSAAGKQGSFCSVKTVAQDFFGGGGAFWQDFYLFF